MLELVPLGHIRSSFSGQEQLAFSTLQGSNLCIPSQLDFRLKTEEGPVESNSSVHLCFACILFVGALLSTGRASQHTPAFWLLLLLLKPQVLLNVCPQKQ